MTIEEAVGWVIDTFEGHLFTDDPVDTGGATRHGITQRTYQYWETRYGAGRTITKKDVQLLTPELAVRIGVDVFAKETHIDQIFDWRLRLLTYDFAFHSGPATAIQALQRALNVAADGKLGPNTLNAAKFVPNAFQTALKVLTEREEFMQALIDRKPSQRRYLFGWWKRTTKLQRLLADN